MTLDRQQKAFVERGVAGARGQHAQMDATCRRRRDQEPLWNELHACRQRCQSVAGELHALDATIAGLPDVVKLDAAQASRDTAFGVRTIDLRRAHDQSSQTRAASLESQQHDLARCDQEIARFANEIAGLEPGYLAKKHGRFWTLAYWTNLFNGAIVQQVEMLVEQQAQARARRQTLAGEIDMTVEEQNRLRAEFDRELTAVLHAEIETRKHALQERRQALENEERRCTEEWEVLCRKLDAEGVEKTSAGVDAARQAWAQKKMADEQRCQFAQQWVKFIEEAGADLATKLTTFANVFAGTIARWHGDAKFREAAAAPIDLVIVEDADTLTDADISKLARLGQRCILVSAALAESPAPSSWWQRLWTALGGDAGRWPCRWRREDGRLVCQMFPIATEDRLHLESERLADSPDIELRILHRPRTRPCLAQVIFPSECKFTEAFTFMVREVQEFPLEPLGATAWWNDDARRHVRHLGPNPGRVHEWLEIEPGVRLGTCGSENGEARKFASIEFDRSAGWDRAKAAAWLYRFRPVHDCERTAFLQTPYRFHAALSAVIPVVLRNDDWVYSDPCQPREGTFEFTAVPQTSRPDWPREGAGLEMDLAAAGRQTDRLPVGLRHGLPARGFVNYTEAQALIRRLETWAREHAASTTRVAVLALYAGQVELLRHLVEQSEVLRARNFSLELALPSRMHQRECDAVFLSLTRSHTHRATAFGDDGKELPLALTRPRSYLFVFGDPGALGKRASWQGPLEQLEAVTAQQEHVRISRLLAYLQKQHAKAPSGNGKE
jgi:hypothetical protein